MNKLKSIAESTFQGLIKLKDLGIGKNGLTSISTNMFNGLKNLKYFAFPRNKLTDDQEKSIRKFLRERGVMIKDY